MPLQAAPSQPPFPRAPEPVAATKSRPPSRWNAGSYVLALGALCLVVAAFIFVSVSWDAIGIWGRTLILLAVTAVFAGVAVWVTVKKLRASAEALWSIFGAMVTLDYFAGRSAGLLGLDSLAASHATALFGVLFVALSVGVALWSLRRNVRVVAAEVGMVLGTYSACSGAQITGVDDATVWSALLAVAVGLALCVVIRRTGFPRAALWAAAAPAIAYMVACVAAIVILAEHPSLHELWIDGHAVPMVVLSVLTVVSGVLVSRWLRAVKQTRWADIVATAAGALGTLGVASLVFVPTTQTDNEDLVQLAFAGLAIVPVAVALRWTGAWGRGVRIAAGLCSVPLFVSCIGWIGAAIGKVLSSTDPVWSMPWDTRLKDIDLPASAWSASIALGALAIAVALARLWSLDKELDPASPWQRLRASAWYAAGGLVVLAVAIQLPLSTLPVVIVAGALLLMAVAAVEEGERSERDAWHLAAGALLVAASIVPLVSQVASGVVWILAALVLGAVARFAASKTYRAVALVASGTAAIAGGLALATASNISDDVLKVVTLIVAFGVGAAAQQVGERRLVRVGLECLASTLVAVALLWGLDSSLGWQSFFWAASGAAFVALGLLVSSRRWALYVGAVMLGTAYVLILAQNDVTTVEAYTAPIGALLLGVGLWAMGKRAELSTWIALSPGLFLAMMPSLPNALDEPTSVRALVLGLVAVVVFALAIKQQWVAPFWFGLVTAVLVLLFNIGPYADSVPRWVIIAIVGVALLAVGVTWEARVKDARSVVSYVRDLR